MSLDALAYVIRQSPYRDKAFIVHSMIADVVNDANDNKFFMAVDTLARKSRVSRSTVLRTLATMTSDGFLERIGRELTADGKERTDLPVRYRFLFPDVPVVFETRSHGDTGLVSRRDRPSSKVTPTRSHGDTQYQENPTRDSKGTSRPSRSDAAEKAGARGRALVDLLVELVVENGSKRPEPNAAWYDAARLLLTADRRDPVEAERLLRWSQEDEFWRANVLSLPTFRRQYDRLRLAANRSGARTGARGGIDRGAALARLEDRRRARAAR